jgi:hypothetical protein
MIKLLAITLAARQERFDFIFANKSCNPSFDSNGWYRPWKRRNMEFNSSIYQPNGGNITEIGETDENVIHLNADEKKI